MRSIKIRTFLLIVIVTAFLGFITAVAAFACYYQPPVTCNEGYHLVDNECVKIVCEDCDVTPTPEEATPTPQEEVSPIPTEMPGQPGNPPLGEGKHNEPVCNGVALSAPILQGYKFNSPTSVFWSWWASLTQGIQHQWLEYGYEKGVYPYNVDVPVNATGFETGALDPNQKIHWARVCVMKDACVACSDDFDPVYQ